MIGLFKFLESNAEYGRETIDVTFIIPICTVLYYSGFYVYDRISKKHDEK